MEEDFRDLLRTAAASGVLLTPAVEVNWVEHPQGRALPGIVLTLVSGLEGYTQAGPDGLTRAVVQVDVYAMAHHVAVGLAREVRTVLSGHRDFGTRGFFEGIFLTATRSGREGGTNEAERPFRQSMDFDVNWRAS
jgi:hypothetical protein